jgi:hypothetical protein
MRVGEICVTARLKPTDVAGCKLRLADFCTLTEALDYAAISRAGAGRTCRASERTICRTCNSPPAAHDLLQEWP